MAYDQALDFDTSLRVWRVRMWEMGHTFEEIDAMAIQDFGDIIGYWHEKSMADEKAARQREAKNSRRK